MSVFIEDQSPFVSHPVESGIQLTEHLFTVSGYVRDLLEGTKFNSNSDIVYYSALLHDIGKLNPYYQYLFYTEEKLRDQKKKELANIYLGQHSLFSAWMASKLLHGKGTLNSKEIHIVACLIASHHSYLRSIINSSITEKSIQFKNSTEKIQLFLNRYQKEVECLKEFADLNWSKCQKEFSRPIKMTGEISKTQDRDSIVSNFVELLLYFSILLQADRGSFSTRNQYELDISIRTQNLVKSKSKLADVRSQFQEDFISKFDIEENITIIQAPTGIGKTKLFLDIISRYLNSGKFTKILYFSPLLALTEDFENKIKQVVEEKDMSSIFVYNHLFSGSLIEKNSSNETISHFWDFDNESFNRKFIITTTQRLLITLYSNGNRDNLKLFSFKNALLIIDEIQVIPKFLLPNFVDLMKSLSKFINTTILLVSATIPIELVVPDTRLIKMDGKAESMYHDITLKKIQFLDRIPDMSIELLKKGKKLFMLNTKSKAVRIFNAISEFIRSYIQKNQDKQQALLENEFGLDLLFYVTTGIRKKTRSKIIGELSRIPNCIVVSTQVIEAGVDINFDTINREIAPLDNIIQVMGRLNREGETKEPLLNVFLYEDGRDHRPYNRLEFEESLKRIRSITNSRELYNSLNDYYKTINSLNNSNRKLLDDLETKMANYDYLGVWDLIYKEVFQSEYGEPVIIPENEDELTQIKNDLLYSPNSLKDLYKKYGNLTAILPVPSAIFHKEKSQEKAQDPKIRKILSLLDERFFEKNILLPKSGCLNELYDEKIGLDKWIEC